MRGEGGGRASGTDGKKQVARFYYLDLTPLAKGNNTIAFKIRLEIKC